MLLELFLTLLVAGLLPLQLLDFGTPEDGDLMPARAVPVAAEENAYELLDDFERAYASPWDLLGDDEFADISLFLEGSEGSERPDLRPVDRVLEKNEGAFGIAHTLMQRSHYRSPRVPHMEAPVTHIVSLRHLADLYLLRCDLRRVRGETDLALDDALLLLSFARRVRANSSSLGELLVANAMISVGTRTLLRVIDGDHPEERLHRTLERYSRCRPDPVDYGRALQHEYAAFRGTLGRFRKGEIPLGDWRLGKRTTGWATYLALKPHRTLGLVAPRLRVLIEQASASYAVVVAGRPDRAERWRFHRQLIAGNVAGFVMVELMLPTVEGTRRREAYTRTLFEATLTVLALKLHRVRHGDWPATLDDLVPDILDAVPIDPYDGQPLRYVAEDRVLYSIGEDLVDGRDEGRDYWPVNPRCPTFLLK